MLGTADPLSAMPDEIIEQIAINLRDWHLDDGQEYASAYLLDNCSDFAHARFDLSSFSKVCTSVRWPAERALYRTIHVHFDGCDGIHGSAHRGFRAGSLHLLLRTLESREDLRRCVRTVQMDWHEERWDESSDSEEEDSDSEEEDSSSEEEDSSSEEEDSSSEEEDSGSEESSDSDSGFVRGADALQQFLSYCPSVRRLDLLTFPSPTLSGIALSGITTVATSGRRALLPTVVKTFPALEDLYFNINSGSDIPSMATHGFDHQLKKLRIDALQMNVSRVFWALEICSHITEHLRLGALGFPLEGLEPPVPTLSPSAGRNLRSLTLVGDELNFLAYPKSDLAQAIGQLPSLQHLHMSRCLSFHPSAFSVLPASLRCLILSEYGEPWVEGRSRVVFIIGLSKCVVQALRPIEMVVIHGVTGEGLERGILGDLSPLQSVCKDLNIPFRRDMSGDDSVDYLEAEFQIRILFS